jgi:hypothetical protein
VIEQHSDESAKAWKAYCCYQNLGPLRSIGSAYAIYRGSQSEAVKPSASFIQWKREFNWDERVCEWDALEETAARERQREIDDEAYQAELELFRQSLLNSGKMGVSIVLNLKKKLLTWVEAHPEITSWSDALTAARIIMPLEMASSEQWAKALHIDMLLDQMNEDDEE